MEPKVFLLFCFCWCLLAYCQALHAPDRPHRVLTAAPLSETSLCSGTVDQVVEYINTTAKCVNAQPFLPLFEGGSVDILKIIQELQNGLVTNLCQSGCLDGVHTIIRAGPQGNDTLCQRLDLLASTDNFICSKNDGSFCWELLDDLYPILRDLDRADTLAFKKYLNETTFNLICNPCIKVLVEQLSVAQQTGAASIGFNTAFVQSALSLLCKKLQGQFCLLELSGLAIDVLEDTDGGFNLSAHADDACSTCGRAILASGSSVLDAALPRQAEQLAFEIQSGCGRTSSNEICLQAFDRNSAEFPLLNAAWGVCKSVIDGTQCTADCGKALEAAYAKSECCTGAYLLYKLLDENDATDIIIRQAFSAWNSQCSLPNTITLEANCRSGSKKKLLNAEFKNLRFGAIKGAESRIVSAFFRDVAKNLGVSPSDFQLVGEVSSSSGTATGYVKLEFQLQAENDDATEAVAAVYVESATTGIMSLENLIAAVSVDMYFIQADGMTLSIDTGGGGGGGGGAAAQTVPVAASVLAATVAALLALRGV